LSFVGYPDKAVLLMLSTSLDMSTFRVPDGKLINNCGYLADFQHKHCAFGNENFKAERLKNPMANQVWLFSIHLHIQQFSILNYRSLMTRLNCLWAVIFSRLIASVLDSQRSRAFLVRIIFTEALKSTI
uniref:Transposase n=1 Tax=Angiostrongylus cantonensis TaxID=6313 RepID=A0A0K0D6P0_ANGCA